MTPRPDESPFTTPKLQEIGAAERDEDEGIDWAKWSSLVRAIGWVGMIPIAWYFGWIYSVGFVAACSLYANASGDWGAYRADVYPYHDRLCRIEAKLDALIEEREAA